MGIARGDLVGHGARRAGVLGLRAGMFTWTARRVLSFMSEASVLNWVPACAGMTEGVFVKRLTCTEIACLASCPGFDQVVGNCYGAWHAEFFALLF